MKKNVRGDTANLADEGRASSLNLVGDEASMSLVKGYNESTLSKPRPWAPPVAAGPPQRHGKAAGVGANRGLRLAQARRSKSLCPVRRNASADGLSPHHAFRTEPDLVGRAVPHVGDPDPGANARVISGSFEFYEQHHRFYYPRRRRGCACFRRGLRTDLAALPVQDGLGQGSAPAQDLRGNYSGVVHWLESQTAGPPA